jgi:hypothetical protein
MVGQIIKQTTGSVNAPLKILYQMKTQSKKKLIELSADLFEKIKRSAQENDRSVNKEINHLLKKSLK